MTKYIFRSESEDGRYTHGAKMELAFEAESLYDILEEFRNFLKGCSFSSELADRIDLLDEEKKTN